MNAVLFWLMILPITGMMFVGLPEFFYPDPEMLNEDWRFIVLVVAAQATFSVILLWGIACVLVVGRRILTSKAGRSRTSFRVVRKEGGTFVVNLLITDILRDCFSILWGLLLVIPGIIYGIRTSFYHVAIVCEGLGYRNALKRSKNVVTGHTWTVFWYMLGLMLVLFLPVIFLTGAFDYVGQNFDVRLLPGLYLINGTVIAFATLLFTLATISLYGEIQKLPSNQEKTSF